MKKVLQEILILVLIFTTVGTAAENYLKNKVIIKLKASTQASSFAGTMLTAEDLPDSVRKLNKANGLKEFKAMGLDKKTKKKLRQAALRSMSVSESVFEKLEAADAEQGLDRIYELNFDDAVDVPLLVAQYQNDDNIEYAQPVYIYRSLAVVPDDTYYPTQSVYLDHLAAGSGWELTTGSASVIVAVLDTGISLNHQDLTGNIWINTGDNNTNGLDDDGNGYADDRYGWNFVPAITNSNINDDNDYYVDESGVTRNSFGHGTMVSGIIGARTNNSKGIAGAVWNTKIMTLKVLDAGGRGDTSGMAAAINYAKYNGATVINMSLGSPGFDNAFNDACAAAYKAGIILVAAMGNSGDSSVEYPAGFDSVIGVGAVDKHDVIAYYSTYGAGSHTTELTAPGGGNVPGNHIISTCAFTRGRVGGLSSNGLYHQASGTSFAAPYVAGLCALMKARYPSLENDELRIALHNGADDLGTTGYDKYYGYGRINFYNSLRLASNYVSRASSALVDVFNFPNPVTDGSTRFSFKAEKQISSARFMIYDLKGRLLTTLESGKGTTTGTYVTGKWECEDDQGNKLPNGTYIYVIEAEDVDGSTHHGRSKLSIVN